MFRYICHFFLIFNLHSCLWMTGRLFLEHVWPLGFCLFWWNHGGTKHVWICTFSRAHKLRQHPKIQHNIFSPYLLGMKSFCLLYYRLIQKIVVFCYHDDCRCPCPSTAFFIVRFHLWTKDFVWKRRLCKQILQRGCCAA